MEKKFLPYLTSWIGILGTVVTIVLTVLNSYTKSAIDKREADLKSLEIKLKERSADLEESKEKIERYKWVLSLFPEIDGENERKKNFSVSLIRLALTKDEAQQLFTGLQASSDKQLQNVGQSGIKVIENEPIALLVGQINASTATARKTAVAKLVNEYKSSGQAVGLVLDLFSKDRIDNLSPSGMINGLYFLTTTDPNAWDKQNTGLARQVIAGLEARSLGNQTKNSVNNFKAFVNKLATDQQ